MATEHTSITVTNAQTSSINAQIDAGEYTNDSESIGDSERRQQEPCFSRNAIRAALLAGEVSGEPYPFNPKAFKQRMLNHHG